MFEIVHLLPTANACGIEAEGLGEEKKMAQSEDPLKPSASTIDESIPQPESLPRTPLPKKGHGRRKKNPLTPKQRGTAERRLQALAENFHPVSFSPGKTLDFSAHEVIFRALGLWHFVHLQFNFEVRSELLVDLIAYYDHSNHRSYINGTRISVTRSDLARALRLPPKKEKVNEFECTDEAVSVLLEFISNYMPYGDDMCILPPEIMQATQFVKDKRPQKVDWAGLMWVLVEKELMEAPKSGICHCASHLQCLIEHLHPLLLQKKERPVLEPVIEAQEEEVFSLEENGNPNAVENEVVIAEEEYDAFDVAAAMKVRSLKDFGNAGSGEFGLTSGEAENVMDGFDQEEKVGEEDKHWRNKEKDKEFVHCFRPCDSRTPAEVDFENLTKVHEQEDQDMEFDKELSTKFLSIGRLSSSDLLQSMATTSNVSAPFEQQINFTDALLAGHGPNISLCAGNNSKRQASSMAAVEESHFEHKQQKRMKRAEQWSNMAFDECMEQMQTGMERAKFIFAEKDQTTLNMHLRIQYLNHMLQEKDQIIQSLRVMVDEQPQWRMVIRNYDHELSLITQMLFGYKKALNETRNSFAEYRKKSSKDEDTLYKDVPGAGGLVLSARDFQKHQLEKEEEKRRDLLGAFGDLEKVLVKLAECDERIMMHNRKLVNLAGEVKQLKDRILYCKSSSS